jgi:hypothetical protein
VLGEVIDQLIGGLVHALGKATVPGHDGSPFRDGSTLGRV